VKKICDKRWKWRHDGGYV